jgi:hypothetical protein
MIVWVLNTWKSGVSHDPSWHGLSPGIRPDHDDAQIDTSCRMVAKLAKHRSNKQHSGSIVAPASKLGMGVLRIFHSSVFAYLATMWCLQVGRLRLNYIPVRKPTSQGIFRCTPQAAKSISR